MRAADFGLQSGLIIRFEIIIYKQHHVWGMAMSKARDTKKDTKKKATKTLKEKKQAKREKKREKAYE